MRLRSTGFTMVELVIALVIGTILLSIAVGSFQNVRSRFAATGAKKMYMTLHQRARSQAVEMGETVRLVVDVQGDSAFIRSQGSGVSAVTRFDEQIGVDLRTRGDVSYFMCMTPRGYADYDCGSLGASGVTQTFGDTVRLEFWRGADSASVLVLPMGQLVG